MTTYEPSHCPYCGTELSTVEVEDAERAFCPDCETVVWQNPVPGATVAVFDGPTVMLVRRSRPPGAGTWSIPGGHLETGEEPARAAARELREETAVTVDPDDLRIASGLYLGDFDGKHMVSFGYAARYEDCEGTPEPASDAEAVEFVDAGAVASGTVDRPLLDLTAKRVRKALAVLGVDDGVGESAQ